MEGGLFLPYLCPCVASLCRGHLFQVEICQHPYLVKRMHWEMTSKKDWRRKLQVVVQMKRQFWPHHNLLDNGINIGGRDVNANLLSKLRPKEFISLDNLLKRSCCIANCMSVRPVQLDPGVYLDIAKIIQAKDFWRCMLMCKSSTCQRFFVFTANTEASAAHWLGQKLCAHFSTSANQETKETL